MQKERKIGKAWVVDCDVHQGNGTAIFKNDSSLHSFHPPVQQLFELEAGQQPRHHLSDGVEDAEYLAKLKEGLVASLQRFAGHAVLRSGADPYKEDHQLGGLALTLEGLVKRDRLVLEAAQI